MSIAKIEKLIDGLERKLGKSIKLLAKGDKLSYGDGIKLGRKSNSMISLVSISDHLASPHANQNPRSTVKKAIKEYDGTQPTSAETTRILAKVEKITAVGEEQVIVMIATKPRFDQLKVGGLIRMNLKKMQEVSTELDKIVETKAPAELKPKAEELSKRRQAALNKAIVAFANSTGGEEKAGEEEDDSD